MKWTSDRPNKIGWYWMRDLSVPMPKMIVYVNDPAISAFGRGYIDLNQLNGTEEWSGPIPPPEESLQNRCAKPPDPASKADPLPKCDKNA